MRASVCFAAALVAGSALAACTPRRAWDPRALGDISPPVLAAVSAEADGAIQMCFDEPVTLIEGSLHVDPAPEQAPASRAEGTSIFLEIRGQLPGREYRLEAAVEDAAGNSSALVARFYGFNPRVPRLLINEFTPRGSGAHPDLAELRVLSDGDLAGVVLYQGTPSDWSDRFVFPACPVRAGEYVLVHFRPEGLPEERDELDARDASGGADASSVALDFWVRGGQGLSGNNGVLTLYDRPDGAIIDGVLYSNRASDSDSAYGGFGSASVLARARELVAAQGWIARAGQVRPEDAVSPEGSSGTRSLARSSTSVDTNSREDWHVTPTRGASWGGANTDARYEPTSR